MGNWSSLGLGDVLASLLPRNKYGIQSRQHPHTGACDAPNGRVIAVRAARRPDQFAPLSTQDCPAIVEKLYEIDPLDFKIHHHLSGHLVREIHTDAVWATIPRAVNGRSAKALLVDRHQRILTKREHSVLFHELKHHVYLATRYCQAAHSNPSLVEHLEYAPRLQELQHPHLLRLYGHFMHNRMLHILTEFCQHGNLAAVLEIDERYETRYHHRLALFRGELALKESTRQICSAIAFMHENKLTHTNVTLENIFVSDNGHLVLGDFKEAVVIDRDRRRPAVKADTARHAFTAPEILSARENPEAEVDLTKSDAWSIGVVIFTLVTRHGLFTAATPADPDFVRFQRMGFMEYYEAWKAVNPWRHGESVSVPEDIQQLLSALLHVHPTKRSTVVEAVQRFAWLQHRTSVIKMEASDWKL